MKLNLVLRVLMHSVSSAYNRLSSEFTLKKLLLRFIDTSQVDLMSFIVFPFLLFFNSCIGIHF